RLEVVHGRSRTRRVHHDAQDAPRHQAPGRSAERSFHTAGAIRRIGRPPRRSAMKRWIERHPVVSFYIVAYAFSLGIAVPLALQTHGVIPAHFPLWLHYVMAFGPAIGALLVGSVVPSSTDLTGRPSAKRLWLLVGAFSPLMPLAIAQVLGTWLNQQTPTWVD